MWFFVTKSIWKPPLPFWSYLYLFICLFINDLLSIYYVPSIVLGAWETAGKKTKCPALLKPTFSWKEGQRQAMNDKQHP